VHSFVYKPPPQLQAWFNYTWNGHQVIFTSDYISLGACVTFHQWNFGDGGWSNLKNPVHYYNIEGNLSVTYCIDNVTYGLEDCYTEIIYNSPEEEYTATPFLLQMDWSFLLWAVYLLIFIAIIKLLVSEVKRMWKG